MERLMMWRSGDNSTAKITVVDDLASWEMINPSDEDDIQSFSFSESLSEKEVSSEDERFGFDDDLKGDGRPGFGEADVEYQEASVIDCCDRIMTDRSSFDQRFGFDDHQNGDERPGFEEEVTGEDYQEEDERPGFDDPILGENVVPELVRSQPDNHVLSNSSLINQRWRFDQDGDEQPGFDELNAGPVQNMLPESGSPPINQRWGYHDDQNDDEWPGFDEHSVGLWEYTVQLIGLGQFDDQEETAENFAPNLVSPHENQRCGLDEDKDCDERLISDENNDDDYDDDTYDLDDNLVPFYASNRFGNQRMGKVGKKVINGKMRRSRHYYNRVV